MSPEDVVLILCDDDALCEDYLENLNTYYTQNPEVLYSFSHVIPYNPLEEKPTKDLAGRPFWLNHNNDVSTAFNVCDSTQVSYRRKVFLDHNLRYPSPAWRCLDAAIHHQLAKLDKCRFNGITGQFKGTFHNQLGRRTTEHDIYNPVDTTLI